MARVNKSVPCPVKRALKPPPSTSTHVESSTTKADVRYVLPANQPRVGTFIPVPVSPRAQQRSPSPSTNSVLLTWLEDTIRINTADVAQPFLDVDILSSVRP
ncbi:hypothetical protein E4U55_004805 [Claviceps digitariae]|nr:hypothetical protein E4U55_004805 [Claviceps digitariae]